MPLHVHMWGNVINAREKCRLTKQITDCLSASQRHTTYKARVELCTLTFKWQTHPHSRLCFCILPIWITPVFNFPPRWPWGIFNAVAQQHLMLHCNSGSVSLCNRRGGFQRGENRWLRLVVLPLWLSGPTGELWWGLLEGCGWMNDG